MVNRSGFFRTALLFLLFFLAAGSWSPVLAQDEATTHIELILDASGSMWAKLGSSTRIEVAKDALGKIIDDLSERKGIAVGLRVYGHRTNDCKDTKLEIPIGPLDGKKMKAFIGKIKPKGKTPIAYSLQEAAKDFRKDFTGSKVIILVTDGLESCNGDPCAAAKALAEKGIVSKIHVVGFGMDKKSVSQLECIVKPSGGLLLEANSAAELAKAFDTIVKTALDTNLEVTGLDGKGKPVGMTVSVLREGDEVLSEKGQTVKANLPEGSYLVRATAAETGEEVFFEGVDLVEDKLTSLKAVFSIARIRARALDSAGKAVRAEWEIFRKDAPEEPLIRFSGADWTEKVLSPGEYTLKAHHKDTKVTLTADAAPGDGETATVELVFAQGKLIISGLDSNGKPIYTDSYVYRAPYDRDNPDEAGRDGGNSHEYFLVPGTYDVLVRENKTKVEQWIKDVVIEGGKTVRKELSFAQGKLIISGLDSNGKPIYTDSYVYRAPYDRDNPDEAGRDGGNSHEYFLVPGTYDVLVRENKTKVEQWIKDVVIEGGKTVRKELSFAQGKLIISGLDSNGKPIYTDSYVYRAPYDRDNPDEAGRDGGNSHEYFLVPGTYDVLVRENKTKVEQWIKDVVIEGGKTVRKELSFAQGKLIISGLDSNGKPIYTDSYVYRAPYDRDNPDEAGRDGGNSHEYFLVPGTYDVLVRDNDTRVEQWIKDVVIEGGKTVRKEVSFSQGTVSLTAKGFEGKPAYFSAEIFKSPAEENDEFVYSDSGEGEVSFPIAPGTYDVRARTEEPRAELWEKGMEVKAGATVKKFFAFSAVRIRITPPKKGKEWTYISVDVFPHPAEENDQLVVSEAGAEEHIQFFLVPGTYDFRIRDDEERETWIRGIELAADETFSREVKFED